MYHQHHHETQQTQQPQQQPLHQQHIHQHQHQHPHQYQQQPQNHHHHKNHGDTMNAGGGGSTTTPASASASASASSASHLDHALLESLFYNEMVLLENSAREHAASSSASCLPTEHDTPYTILEKEILRDFGVGGGPTLLPPTATPAAANVAANPHSLGSAPATSAPMVYASNHSPLQQRTNNPATNSEYSTAMLPPAVSPQDQQQQQQQQQQQPPMQQQQQHTNPPPPPDHHQSHLHQTPDTSTIPQYASSTGGTAYNISSDGACSTTTTAQTIGSGIVVGQQQQQQQQQHQQQQQQPQHVSLGGMVCADPQATAMAAAAAAAMLNPLANSNNNNNNNKRGRGIKFDSVAAGAVPMMASSNTTPKAASLGAGATATASAAMPTPTGNGMVAAPPPQTNADPTRGSRSPQPSNGATPSSSSAPPPPTVQVSRDRARQLVDQFATLAARLGIDLPDSVLQSLTSAAAKNNPTLLLDPTQQQQQQQQHQQQQQQQQQITANPIITAGVANGTSTAASNSATHSYKAKTPPGTAPPPPAATEVTAKDENSCSSSTELPTMAPTVMELRKTAEEAIAAVTQPIRDQTMSTRTENSAGTSATINGSSGNSTTTNAPTSSSGNENKPTYSKRRKKPRLSDCEAKLAQLKAENEQLKRHLQNISNKAHKFDMEKDKASKQIAQLMHDPNAGPREMEIAVRKFSDMYSDYGINRQQELSFHLEQLQRLVNPTNFTKMGLWTLGHSNQGTKKNPIAGILVEELDITPQQGRKILDQSEKIRQLCQNLKEAHSLLVKLKYLCEKKTRTFQDRMNKCTEILTAKQVVKLIIWINGHTQLLDSVCPGWGTEHIHSKK